MSDKFEWLFDVEDEEDQEPAPECNARRQPASLPIRVFLGLAGLLGLLFGLWRLWQTQQADSEAPETVLMRRIQGVLDLEQEAVLDGNGDLFLRFQARDPAWISAQIRPESQAATRRGLQVTYAEQVGEFVLANVAWR